MNKMFYFFLLSFPLFSQSYYIDNSSAINGNGSLLHPWNSIDAIIWSNIPDNSYIEFNFKRTSTPYQSSNDSAVLLIPRNKIIASLIISPYDDQLEEDKSNRQVTFDGVNIKSYGIRIQPNGTNYVIPAVYIEEINFQNIVVDAIFAKGLSDRGMDICTIASCNINNMIGDADTAKNKRSISDAAIKVQYSNAVNIQNCNISSIYNSLAQNDGIFISNSSNISLQNNHIEIKNDFIQYFQQDATYLPHSDCIQTSECTNILAQGNILINSSIFTNVADSVIHAYRQALYIGTTNGKVKIFNNAITHLNSDNLINMDFSRSPDTTLIFNNTLIGKQNPQHLVNLNKSTGNLGILRIMNNIFYKNGAITGNNPDAIKFIGINKENLDSTILNYNCYYNLSSPIYSSILTSNGRDSCKLFSNRRDRYSLITNPLFKNIVDYDYSLEDTTELKNKGTYNNEINMDILKNSRPNWMKNSFDIGAYELPDAQIKIGVVQANKNQQINHHIQFLGVTWVKQDNLYESSTNANIYTFKTIGNSDTAKEYWKGFTYNWVHQQQDTTNKPMDIGFYKIYNDSAYFYLDGRHWEKDSANFNPTIYLRYNASLANYQYNNIENNWATIENGEVKRIWDIKGEQPRTEDLNNYWTNSLVLLNKNNSPYLIGGYYPGGNANKYILYSKWTNRPKVIPVFAVKYTGYSSTPIDFYDQDLLLGGQYPLEYKLEAYNDNTFIATSNIISTTTGGIFKSKGKNKEFSFSLLQNYPNPFNPATKIAFSIKEKSLTIVKVFDILGKEVTTLKNEILDPGEYNVTFNNVGLSSGVYFYRIDSGNYHQTKKMILLK